MSSKSRNLFGIVFILLIIIALPAVLFLTKQQQDIRPRALSGTVNLLLSSTGTTSNVGGQTDVVVSAQLTDPNVKMSGADITIYYDKNKLNVSSIIPAATSYDPNGAFTDVPYLTSGGNVDSTFNFLRFVVVARKPDAQLPSGTVQLGRISFTSIGEGAAVIKFPDDNSLLQVVGTSGTVSSITPVPLPTTLPSPTAAAP